MSFFRARTQRRNGVTPKTITPPGNPYDVLLMRMHAQINFWGTTIDDILRIEARCMRCGIGSRRLIQ